MTAQIIAFPARPCAPADDPHQRLARALRGLDAALAQQRQAVAEWRTALASLRTTVQGVGEGLQHYGGALERLQAGIDGLNGQATRLEQWADGRLTGDSATG